MKLKLFLSVLVLAVAIQFVPYGQSRSNPPVLAEPQWDRPATRQLFTRACADCHSHRTKWPWYSRFAPVSWLVHADVDEGREHFNVSLWEIQGKNKGNKAAEELREGEMPPLIYLLAHPEARLDGTEKATLGAGLVATFGSAEQEDRKH